MQYLSVSEMNVCVFTITNVNVMECRKHVSEMLTSRILWRQCIPHNMLWSIRRLQYICWRLTGCTGFGSSDLESLLWSDPFSLRDTPTRWGWFARCVSRILCRPPPHLRHRGITFKRTANQLAMLRSCNWSLIIAIDPALDLAPVTILIGILNNAMLRQWIIARRMLPELTTTD